MKEDYIYPAKIQKSGDTIQLMFVDFPEILVETHNIEEAVKEAQESLALSLLDFISENRKLPEPSEVNNAIYVHVWLPLYRSRAKEVYVKKTVTIPQWLDLLAKENNINFSSCLVKGIKSELGIN